MEISYDKNADAMYIRLVKGPFDRNRKIDDFTVLDLDKDGRLLGIEFLAVSKRFPTKTFSEVHLKNMKAVC
jgi:uncharacterized protein YuzE